MLLHVLFVGQSSIINNVYGQISGINHTEGEFTAHHSLFDEFLSRSSRITQKVRIASHYTETMERIPDSILKGEQQIDMLVVDGAAISIKSQEDFLLLLRRSTRAWLKSGCKVTRHAQSVILITSRPQPHTPWVTHHSIVNVFYPVSAELLSAKVLFVAVSLIENAIDNPWVKRRARKLKDRPVIHSTKMYGDTFNGLGNVLIRVMNKGCEPWLFASYTGAVVANLIEYIQAYREKNHLESQIYMIHGNSEHALACNASAFSMLGYGSYLISVTIGMMLDFKGTLLNLVRSKSKGIIVCGEGDPSLHFGCQSMINPIEDVRAILASMKIPFVCMLSVDSLQSDFDAFMSIHEIAEGPVVILASPKVLDSSIEINIHHSLVVESLTPEIIDNKLDDNVVLHDLSEKLIDPNRDILLIVDELLSDEDQVMLRQLSLTYGLAVVDTVQHPGVVSRYWYRDGIYKDCQPYYLGVIGIYGTSRPVYDFIFESGKPRKKELLTVVGLGGLFDQPSTPYTTGDLKTNVDVYQCLSADDYGNPFIENKIKLSVSRFLRWLYDMFSCRSSSEKFKRRRDVIECALHYVPDPFTRLYSAPVSPNYFFYAMANTLKKQLSHLPPYVCAFDAGRFGFSAMRSIPRVAPCFSGVYGRGAMGDALQALPALALNNPTTLAFIGDAARALVGDLPSMLMRTLNERNFRGRLLVFTGVNGSLSMIQTYQERGMFSYVSNQVQLPHILKPDSKWMWNGVEYHQLTVDHFDPSVFIGWSNTNGAVFLIDVLLEHNNADDIYTHLMPDSWWVQS